MKIKLINYGSEFMPKRMHYNDAGADVYAPASYDIADGKTKAIPLGFGVNIPDGFVGFIFPRSSLCIQGVTCELPPIDAGYTGEIHAVISYKSQLPFNNLRPVAKSLRIRKGDRIGQLVILPVVIADFYLEDKKERGHNAFGSTGGNIKDETD